MKSKWSIKILMLGILSCMSSISFGGVKTSDSLLIQRIYDYRRNFAAEVCDSTRNIYIKYDVEGSESEALDGSKTVIQRDKPKLLVSLYHRTEDMFALPLKVKKLNPAYKLYLRQHPYIPAWDMNLYCI